jgi:(p)ppGpp synthase/HD superfamily hydrolase
MTQMTDDQEKKQSLMANLERAIEIAVLAHKGASDKSGAPYILHPLRLMIGIEDIEAKIVAALHDVVEDSKSPHRWGLEELEAEGFSANVIEAIGCVTKRPSEPYETSSEPARRPSDNCRSPRQYEPGQTRSGNHREGCRQNPKISACVGSTNKPVATF